MVNRNSSYISHLAKNEGRESEKNFIATKVASSSDRDTSENHKIHHDNKLPFYLKLSMFGILVLVLQCFNENTFGNSFECENIMQEGALDLGVNRSLGELVKNVSTPKRTIKISNIPEKIEEESSISEYVEEVDNDDDEEDDKEKYRKMAEEAYKQKMEERYRMEMEEDGPTHVPGPGHNHNHGPPNLSEEELIQLLKVLPPPPPEFFKRRFGIVPGSNADRRLPFNNPQQMLQFLKLVNEKHNMVCGNDSCCNDGNCEEDEEENPSVIDNIIRDISNVAPVILPAIPPVLMMFIGTQRTYLLLYTLSLIKDAYNFIQRARNQ
ncbi:Plasmodium exported protein, unknown function [Plasmodium knowlesi strain H]|uniref:Uncharacterized protein n=3 Tax=Plasmodium knowlesi TaxID=5850 RepID=A0A5K1UMX4_PLAKH|nr:Plasmodium exported protein, unknown function [Plasmodium knowlesi strain H]OTN67867.1 Uncharacterized protein PKNOH_S05370700 [Plasmodium knowlesi]CAA9990298.1 Plasmodium exported protein, unknown function [Plasmodium knowlesi strain H]SBO19504.1 Plasmodium exported protein, unknown function [Plasmodium knowlesi strain H]SBO22828.1 Plasmodium exported protein, unknown function [Plasmodium knowlesi strain H]VVS79772.1 Plasmodium exported protein, unknown function [Plasmodium knowlesi strain|eukprot:XP_002260698.1 hypothetical protein, conserved in Plasmodium species [Plasmodium knowlesi strain H]